MRYKGIRLNANPLQFGRADPGSGELRRRESALLRSDDLPLVNWTLFEVTDEGEPLHPIGGLHESVLDTDPSGREMPPGGVGREG